MSKEIKLNILVTVMTLLMGGIIWSLTAFAYVHSNFTSKEMLHVLIKRVDRMDVKLDRLLEQTK